MNLFKIFNRNARNKEMRPNDINKKSIQEIDLPSNNIQIITELSDANYLCELLPNGNTIAEQQSIDYKIKTGSYVAEAPAIYGMKIISNIIPPRDNYSRLNADEKAFFYAFYQKLIEAKYNPGLVQLTRLSSGTFNVDYVSLCYIGKICLYNTPPTYAVIKKGNKRATKNFDTFDEAKHFASTNNAFEVQERTIASNAYMQYCIGLTSVKELRSPSLQQCIDTIPRWIKYLNYCKRN